MESENVGRIYVYFWSRHLSLLESRSLIVFTGKHSKLLFEIIFESIFISFPVGKIKSGVMQLVLTSCLSKADFFSLQENDVWLQPALVCLFWEC